MILFSYAFGISIILFILGLIGVIIRHNFLFILLGLEIMINAAALAFVIVGVYLNQEDGHIMYILIITVAAVESAVSLALLLQFYRRYYNLDTTNISGINDNES